MNLATRFLGLATLLFLINAACLSSPGQGCKRLLYVLVEVDPAGLPGSVGRPYPPGVCLYLAGCQRQPGNQSGRTSRNDTTGT